MDIEDKELPEELSEYKEIIEDLPESRPHHYIFAHRVLPRLTLAKGEGNILGLLFSSQAREVLLELWSHIGEDLEESERLEAEGLDIQIEHFPGRRLVALITLPHPRGMVEAFYVSIVVDPPGKRFFFLKKPPRVRYFTLENSFNIEDGTPRTIFCSWVIDKKGDSNHLNYGDGPAPGHTPYLRFLKEFLEHPLKPLAGLEEEKGLA